MSIETDFVHYIAAVAAECYRVTAIHCSPTGEKKVLIVDRDPDGVSRGFPPEALMARLPELRRLQNRDEHIYLTPLSEKTHHILVDDMDAHKMACLLADGYTPAVMLESSPGHFQGVVCVPMMGSPHDARIGNAITAHLNKTYGNVKLSGAIHPHRAPGFENRKPQYHHPDTGFPVVRIVAAQGGTCVKSAALGETFCRQYEEEAAKRPSRGAPQHAIKAPETTSGTVHTQAYHRHRLDIEKTYQSADLSRLDAMIAVRLRVTGHSEADVRETLLTCAPTIRQSGDAHHLWADYATRTARYAFGAKGDAEVARYKKNKSRWQKIERGEHVAPWRPPGMRQAQAPQQRF
jgi:hypothetical protein